MTNSATTAEACHGVSMAPSEAAAAREIVEATGAADAALLIVFVSPRYDPHCMAAELAALAPETLVIGCTTAGEIGPEGYVEGAIVGVGLPRSAFWATATLIEDIDRFSIDRGVVAAHQVMTDLAAWHSSSLDECFAISLIDGVSGQEEALVSSFVGPLKGVPLFGGSAGDGLMLKRSFVIHGGRAYQNAAVLALVRTSRPFRVFKFDHFEPTDEKMVVTEADPEKRLVREINAEPAAPEYARMVGLDPHQLSSFVFAAHPVVVRVGGEYHVRAIQQVVDGRDLKFYCAIDEGLVLTVARGRNLADHLDESLSSLTVEDRPPALILGFDCILRRLEAEQSQQSARVSAILCRHRVVGFNTYGEQYRAMHANQTFTGVVIGRGV